jgi:hypothetical protein
LLSIQIDGAALQDSLGALSIEVVFVPASYGNQI